MDYQENRSINIGKEKKVNDIVTNLRKVKEYIKKLNFF